MVERLVHAELQGYRVFEPACHGRLKSQIEWFKDVDFGIILRSIEFWTRWMTKEPYERSGTSSGSSWRLKQSGRDEIERYFATLSEPNAKYRKESSKAKTLPRYNLRPRPAANASLDGSNLSKSWNFFAVAKWTCRLQTITDQAEFLHYHN